MVLKRLLLMIGIVGGIALTARAAAFLPANDSVVLERLPANFSARPRAVTAPKTHDESIAAARFYLEAVRLDGDPRYLAYAEKALQPLITAPAPTGSALHLQAVVLQSRHDFQGALKLLDRVHQSDPRNAEAWLLRASIEQARGEYDAARRAIAALLPLSRGPSTLVAAASLSSCTGRAREAYDSLREQTVRLRGSAAEQAWVYETLGEIAVRLGLNKEAEEHFADALQRFPSTITLASQADVLLAQARWSDVAALLTGRGSALPVRVRLLMAQQKLGRTTWSDEAKTLKAELDTETATFPHAREAALFYLHVLPDAARALEFAKGNWQAQKEPIDLLILLQAALQARDTATVAEVRSRLDATKLQDVRIERALPTSDATTSL